MIIGEVPVKMTFQAEKPFSLLFILFLLSCYLGVVFMILSLYFVVPFLLLIQSNKNTSHNNTSKEQNKNSRQLRYIYIYKRLQSR